MESVRMFSRRVVHRGWVVLVGFVTGALGAASELANATLVMPGWLGLSILAVSVVIAFFWAFHDYRTEKETEIFGLLERLKAVEAAPKFKFQDLLREAQALREELTPDKTDHELRSQVAAWVVGVRLAVASHAPEYGEELEIEVPEGAGLESLLGIVDENYRVLSRVCQRL